MAETASARMRSDPVVNTVEEVDEKRKVHFRVDYYMKLSNMEYWYEDTFYIT